MKRFVIVVAAALACVCGLSASSEKAAPAPEAKRTKWEYKVVTRNELRNAAMDNEELIQRAKKWWEGQVDPRTAKATFSLPAALERLDDWEGVACGAFGEAGWELAAVTGLGNEQHYIFKRPAK
jgi:hypothetical protein